MTPWQWWVTDLHGEDFGEWQLGGYESREAAIDAANREWFPGAAFYLIEARSSESMKYKGADIVPFLRTRNKERLIAGTGEQ